MAANTMVTLGPDTFTILWRHIWRHLNSFGDTFKIHWRHFQDTLVTLQHLNSFYDIWRQLATLRDSWRQFETVGTTFMTKYINSVAKCLNAVNKNVRDTSRHFVYLATLGDTFTIHWRQNEFCCQCIANCRGPNLTGVLIHSTTFCDSWRHFTTVGDTLIHIHNKKVKSVGMCLIVGN